MRILRLLGGVSIVILCIGSLAPAGGQSGTRKVTDPKGLFTLGIPDDWVVRPPGTGRVSAAVQVRAPARIVSSISVGPRTEDVFLDAVALEYPRPVSPEAYEEQVRQALSNPVFTVTQHDAAKIAGREAYYAYFVETGVNWYGVAVFFTIGRLGFTFVGATINDPEHIRGTFPTISRILETFHPTSAIRESMVPVLLRNMAGRAVP